MERVGKEDRFTPMRIASRHAGVAIDGKGQLRTVHGLRYLHVSSGICAHHVEAPLFIHRTSRRCRMGTITKRKVKGKGYTSAAVDQQRVTHALTTAGPSFGIGPRTKGKS